MDRRSAIAHVLTTAELMGVTLDELADLVEAAKDDVVMPTVATFHDRVIAIESAKAGWDKRMGLHRDFVDQFADRPLDGVKPRDVEAYARARAEDVKAREPDRLARLDDDGLSGARRRTGKGAQRNVIEAARAFFAVAVDDGLLRDNPALKVRLPRRPASDVRAISLDQVGDLFGMLAADRDPHLEVALIWFHLETGARRGGAIDLRVRDLKHDQHEIALFEKGDVERLQPCSPELLDTLQRLARHRGATNPADHVFNYVPARGDDSPQPVSPKYYEQLLNRIRRELPWAREVWLKTHDLRHTAITNIERISGSTAVARLFAGHADRQTTDTYDRADRRELRAAVDAWSATIQR